MDKKNRVSPSLPTGECGITYSYIENQEYQCNHDEEEGGKSPSKPSQKDGAGNPKQGRNTWANKRKTESNNLKKVRDYLSRLEKCGCKKKCEIMKNFPLSCYPSRLQNCGCKKKCEIMKKFPLSCNPSRLLNCGCKTKCKMIKNIPLSCYPSRLENSECKERCKMCFLKIQRRWREMAYMIELWRSSLKQIEGHLGANIASYFVFLRWLFLLDIFLFFLLFVTIVFFQITFSVSDYDEYVQGKDSFYFSTNLADTCTASYNVNVSSDALQLILDFLQGTGWMERTAMFYGYYSNAEVKLAISDYNMPLAYFLAICFAILVSSLLLTGKPIESFRLYVMENEVHWTIRVFAVWDYSLNEEDAIRQKQKNISYALIADLREQRNNRDIAQRKCAGIYTIRFFVNFLIICMVGGALAAIYYAQEFSSNFTTSANVNNYHSLVKLLVQFLPSLVITLLNAVYPLIFNLLVTLEKYRPAFEFKISLIRKVFLKLASLAMLMTSLYIQITCSDQNSCRVGQNKCPAIQRDTSSKKLPFQKTFTYETDYKQCWETYVGQAIYKLILLNFLVEIVFTLLVELPRKLITTKLNCGLDKTIQPAVFDLPSNFLELVYAQTLCWLGLYYAPLIPAIYILKLFVIFYLKKLSAMYNTDPIESRSQASRSNSYFMIILMVAFFKICIPVSHTLVKMTPSSMCGPFRIYNSPKDIFSVAMTNTGYWFQVVYSILTPLAIILLVMALYYFMIFSSGRRETVPFVKHQEPKDSPQLYESNLQISSTIDARGKELFTLPSNEMNGNKRTPVSIIINTEQADVARLLDYSENILSLREF